MLGSAWRQHEIKRAAIELPAWRRIACVGCRIVDEGPAPALRRDQSVDSVAERSRRNRLEILVGKGISPQDRGRPARGLRAAETAIGLGRLLGGVCVPETLIARRVGSSRKFSRQQIIRQPARKTVVQESQRHKAGEHRKRSAGSRQQPSRRPEIALRSDRLLDIAVRERAERQRGQHHHDLLRAADVITAHRQPAQGEHPDRPVPQVNRIGPVADALDRQIIRAGCPRLLPCRAATIMAAPRIGRIVSMPGHRASGKG